MVKDTLTTYANAPMAPYLVFPPKTRSKEAAPKTQNFIPPFFLGEDA